jgi:hypothetical protein
MCFSGALVTSGVAVVFIVGPQAFGLHRASSTGTDADMHLVAHVSLVI